MLTTEASSPPVFEAQTSSPASTTVSSFLALDQCVENDEPRDKFQLQMQHTHQLNIGDIPASGVEGFNMEDGNLLLKTEEVIHRVHWSVLRPHSEYFQGLYQEHAKSGHLRDPILLEGVAAQDMVRLLTILYPTRVNQLPFSSKAEWLSVLHLAHELQFSAARLLAVQEIFQYLSAIDKIVLGLRYDVPQWLLGAYVEVCQRDALLSLEEGERLGVRNIIAINQARHAIRERIMCSQEIEHIVWRICCPTTDIPELEWPHPCKMPHAEAIFVDTQDRILQDARICLAKWQMKRNIEAAAWSQFKEAKSRLRENGDTTAFEKEARALLGNGYSNREARTLSNGWTGRSVFLFFFGLLLVGFWYMAKFAFPTPHDSGYTRAHEFDDQVEVVTLE